ncbi:hypothetical protein [Mycoplasmopsis arginini]|uniref:hypothetical protein n=1 Tax=Mycoplasmopsis arginini TaxID=2094 RepID=UPI00039B317C|nr:hypothetical protein [Mycoplasmopsis arginini]MDI3348514.1 hypothetical protein [Mycoplasmopsis arginini]MDI3348928.1 hypothetical protein [Mycoplasmopsis arginini]MDI3351580.1 hypothetical protein [Mycoplasmopsis arginini]MDI3352114.1 hypothetical protein [Mycoplasmopsis arginini]MDP4042850.1 hypothetical protein [Mycoplasmopsis arginini]
MDIITIVFLILSFGLSALVITISAFLFKKTIKKDLIITSYCSLSALSPILIFLLVLVSYFTKVLLVFCILAIFTIIVSGIIFLIARILDWKRSAENKSKR